MISFLIVVIAILCVFSIVLIRRIAVFKEANTQLLHDVGKLESDLRTRSRDTEELRGAVRHFEEENGNLREENGSLRADLDAVEEELKETTEEHYLRNTSATFAK